MKKILLTSLLALSFVSNYTLAATSGKTLAVIATEQNGYTFANWKAGMSCSIEYEGKVISIVASPDPVTPTIPRIKVYRSGTSPVANYKGTWGAINNSIPNEPKRAYTDPVATLYVALSPAPVLTTGGYPFTETTTMNGETKVHHIRLYPNGFYYAISPSATTVPTTFMPGC